MRGKLATYEQKQNQANRKGAHSLVATTCKEGLKYLQQKVQAKTRAHENDTTQQQSQKPKQARIEGKQTSKTMTKRDLYKKKAPKTCTAMR